MILGHLSGPDGDLVPAGGAAGALDRTPVGEAARTAAFWQLSATFLTCGFSMSLLSAHGVPMLTDHGYTPIFASWALGVLGGSSILFTMMLGTASDRFGRRPVLSAIYAGRALVFAGFFFIRDNPAAIITVAVLGGITMAGTMSMTSALTADIYGCHSVGGILGVIFLVHQMGAAVGTWLAGALFEATCRYGAAFAMGEPGGQQHERRDLVVGARLSGSLASPAAAARKASAPDGRAATREAVGLRVGAPDAIVVARLGTPPHSSR